MATPDPRPKMFKQKIAKNAKRHSQGRKKVPRFRPVLGPQNTPVVLRSQFSDYVRNTVHVAFH